jgi:5-methylcytosine-specific restriction endonuclease McrA
MPSRSMNKAGRLGGTRMSGTVTRWRYSAGLAWSRAGVFARDDCRCGYCGQTATTIDHVLPRSRGGRNTWLNTVAACGGCNQRKGDRTPAEAGMALRIQQTVPTWAALSAARR